MNSDFKPNCRSTGIGSLPFVDAAEACTMLLENVDFPFWPQLPLRDFREQMIPQYAEGVPRVEIDAENRKVRLDPGGSNHEAIAAFYEKYLSGDTTPFAISDDSSKGFGAFRQVIASRKWPVVKGQVTGPLTFALSVQDPAGRPAYYDFEMLDMIQKALARKAQWQIERLRGNAEKVLIFIDEPILAAFGTSTYVSIGKDDVVRALNDVIGPIHEAGGLAGVHCCGNTDWSVLAATDADVASFDAFEYSRSVSLYPDEIRAFLDRGGALAWGVVPTRDDAGAQTIASLRARLLEGFKFLEDKGFDRKLLLERCLLTPSCGAGNLGIAETRKVFCLLNKLSKSLRQEFYPEE